MFFIVSIMDTTTYEKLFGMCVMAKTWDQPLTCLEHRWAKENSLVDIPYREAKDLESLFAKVLKGRYYRKSNPLDSSKSYSLSFG